MKIIRIGKKQQQPQLSDAEKKNKPDFNFSKNFDKLTKDEITRFVKFIGVLEISKQNEYRIKNSWRFHQIKYGKRK